jgi:hypothetical protein
MGPTRSIPAGAPPRRDPLERSPAVEGCQNPHSRFEEVWQPCDCRGRFAPVRLRCVCQARLGSLLRLIFLSG